MTHNEQIELTSEELNLWMIVDDFDAPVTVEELREKTGDLGDELPARLSQLIQKRTITQVVTLPSPSLPQLPATVAPPSTYRTIVARSDLRQA